MLKDLSEEFFKEYTQIILDYKTNLQSIEDLSNEIKVLIQEKDTITKSFNDNNIFYIIGYIISFISFFLLFNKDQNTLETTILGSMFISFWFALIPSSFLYFLFFPSKKIKSLDQAIEKTNLKIKNLNTFNQQCFDKIKPFEKLISEESLILLSNFYHTHLYRQRSGTEDFNIKLSHFSDLINEASIISESLITTQIPLEKYRDYLAKRSSINTKSNISSHHSHPIQRIATQLRSSETLLKKEEYVSPEQRYRTARKIDNWEKINKDKLITGSEGEKIALFIEKNFLESIGRKDLSEKVRHVSVEDGDGLGYDILSFFEDGSNKYIEVKSTQSNINAPFYISKNELYFLQEHKNDYFIYRIQLSDVEPLLKAYSSTEILELFDIIPSYYTVKMK